MSRHLVSVRVTKHGKFRKTHVAEINAPTVDEALRHLENRCRPGGEFARKFPGATFSEFRPLQETGPKPSELLYMTTDPSETPLIMPAWARSVPALAKQIDDGYALRRAAGLPVDGALPIELVCE